jgi:hypothetical protein
MTQMIDHLIKIKGVTSVFMEGIEVGIDRLDVEVEIDMEGLTEMNALQNTIRATAKTGRAMKDIEKVMKGGRPTKRGAKKRKRKNCKERRSRIPND